MACLRYVRCLCVCTAICTVALGISVYVFFTSCDAVHAFPDYIVSSLQCQTAGVWYVCTRYVTRPPVVEQAVMSAGGVIALMHACGGSSSELQIATLTVLRQLVVQPTGPDAFLVARAVPLLAMLQHSLVAEIRILATKILDRISASSSVAEEAIADEQLVQVRSAATCQKALYLLCWQSSLSV